MKSKFVNPFTDFGFKKIFGEDAGMATVADEKLKAKQIGIAVKCLKKGMQMPEIADITGLAADDISGLKI